MEEKRTIMAIESSCDETAVAVMRDHGDRVEVLSSVISSQIELHAEWGGVVPELASRNHLLKLPSLLKEALTEAGITIDKVDGFAATNGPGLASSLLIGNTAAKAMAIAARKPYCAINHMEGHLASPFLDQGDGSIQPHVALIVSGGHTMLIKTMGVGEYELLGETQDDAAGEAFDKIAKMLGLPYPGGPVIEKLAQSGDPKRFNFPRSMVRKDNLDFSFSGLKTAVLYELAKLAPETGRPAKEDLPDLCASFQQAVIDVLVKKALIALRVSGLNKLTVSGGVSCNGALIEALKGACEKSKLDFLHCSKHLSTDNAIMIGLVGVLKARQNQSDSMKVDINPNLSLTP